MPKSGTIKGRDFNYNIINKQKLQKMKLITIAMLVAYAAAVKVSEGYQSPSNYA